MIHEPETAVEPLAIDERTAAKMLGVSVRTLYSLRHTAGLPYVRTSETGAIRYRPDALRRWLADHERTI